MTTDVQPISRAHGTVDRIVGAAERVAVRALAGWRLPALITLAAALVRFVRLNHPSTIVPLDETYYAPNSYGYLCHGADMGFAAGSNVQTCDALEPVFAVHPPAAKLLIAIGLKLFGYNAFGWRASAAFFGSLSVLVMYLIGRRLWDSRWLAAAAALLLGVEGLHFVQSRLAMLDIFLMFFILLGIWLLLEDRARPPDRRGLRWWRLGSGVAFGLAIASKWAAAPLLPVVFAVGLAWEVIRARERRETEAKVDEPDGEATAPPPVRANHPRGLVFQAGALAFTFGLLPVLVYVASYTPWFLSTKRYVPPLCYETVGEERVAKAGMSLWICNQREIFNYHKNLRSFEEDGKPKHPYMSQAWSWPWISRPAAHHYTHTCQPGGGAPTDGACPAGQVLADEEILGLPNPVIWWTGFFIALPLCLWWMIVRRDETAALLVVFFLPLVLPWFLTTRPLFLFYMTPAVPLLVLMVVHVMRVWRLRAAAVAFTLLAVGAFVFFYPVLAAYPLPPEGAFGWQSRIWFGHLFVGDCRADADAIRLFCWI